VEAIVGFFKGDLALGVVGIAAAAVFLTLARALLPKTDRDRAKVAAIYLALAILFGVALLIWGGATLDGIVAVLSAALTLLIGAAIVVGVVDQGEVNFQTVTGAVCVYLLLGFMFVFIYGSIAEFGHGALFAQGTDGTRGIRVYFSYVTLTTVGYGDYTMRTSGARMFAVLEMLMGQLYLVTVLALLVSRMRPGTRWGPKPTDESEQT